MQCSVFIATSVDGFCEGIAFSPALRQTIDVAAHAAGLDATWMTGAQRLADYKLVAMDMDSTLITIECIDEIADMQGLKPQVAAITEAAMRGELDFSESLRRRVALLAETIDQAREVMVFGDSGLLACSPPDRAMLFAR